MFSLPLVCPQEHESNRLEPIIFNSFLWSIFCQTYCLTVSWHRETALGPSRWREWRENISNSRTWSDGFWFQCVLRPISNIDKFWFESWKGIKIREGYRTIQATISCHMIQTPEIGQNNHKNWRLSEGWKIWRASFPLKAEVSGELREAIVVCHTVRSPSKGTMSSLVTKQGLLMNSIQTWLARGCKENSLLRASHCICRCDCSAIIAPKIPDTVTAMRPAQWASHVSSQTMEFIHFLRCLSKENEFLRLTQFVNWFRLMKSKGQDVIWVANRHIHRLQILDLLLVWFRGETINWWRITALCGFDFRSKMSPLVPNEKSKSSSFKSAPRRMIVVDAIYLSVLICWLWASISPHSSSVEPRLLT